MDPAVDPRVAELREQERRERVKQFGQIITGLAGFVWALMVLTGRR